MSKIHVEVFWKNMWKKLAWINDLEEVKSVEKCPCGKKRNKFLWKKLHI
jgi:hypothetical protein